MKVCSVLWSVLTYAAVPYCHAGVSIGPAQISNCWGKASTFGVYPAGSGGFSLVCHTPNTPSAWSAGKPYSWMTQLTSSDTLDGVPLPSSTHVYTDSAGNDYQAATGVYGSNRWWTRVTYNNSLQSDPGGLFGQVISAPPDAKVESTTQGSGNLNELYTIYARPISRVEGWKNLPLGTHRFQRTVSAYLQSGVFYNGINMSKYWGDYGLTFTQTLTVSRECNISPNSTTLHFGVVSTGQVKQLPLNIDIECDYPVANDKQIALQFSLSGNISKENNEISIYKVRSSGQKEEIGFNKDIPSLAERADFLIELSPNSKSLMGDKVASLNITITNV